MPQVTDGDHQRHQSAIFLVHLGLTQFLIIHKNRETPPPSYDEIHKCPQEMTGYQLLPRTCHDSLVVNNDEVEDKDEYEYVIEKGCFPKDRKVLSKSILAFSGPPISYLQSIIFLTNFIHNNRIKTHSRVDN